MAELRAPKPFEDTPAVRQSINDGVSFVQGILNDGGKHEVQFAKSKSGRAGFWDNSFGLDNVIEMPGDVYIRTGVSEGTHTVVHELGHLIEHRKPGVRERAQAFLEYRVAGETPVDMGELRKSPEMAGEMGRKDNFDKVFGDRSGYYVGKVYSSGSTEIISMGLEQMYRDPVEFARKDPEYFQFMVSVLRMPAKKG